MGCEVASLGDDAFEFCFAISGLCHQKGQVSEWCLGEELRPYRRILIKGVDLQLDLAQLGVEARKFGFVVAIGQLEYPASLDVAPLTLVAEHLSIEFVAGN